jgi:antitoxin ParD1/3/4
MEERKSKLEALRAHLAQGAQKAKAGDFVDDFSMDALISDLDNEA